MKAILSFLFISISAFASPMMPPGHTQHDYACTITPNATMSMGIAMPPQMIMLHHHIGCSGESVYVNLIERTGAVSDDISCQRDWDMMIANGAFYTCATGNSMFVDVLNGTGTWTMGGINYAMECTSAVTVE